MKAYRLTAIVGRTAHRLHIYFQLIYSHYAAPQTSMRGDFCPAVIFHDTEVEAKMGKHVSTEKKTEASDWGGVVGASFMLCSAPEL